jgi:hypothetical protein
MLTEMANVNDVPITIGQHYEAILEETLKIMVPDAPIMSLNIFIRNLLKLLANGDRSLLVDLLMKAGY